MGGVRWGGGEAGTYVVNNKTPNHHMRHLNQHNENHRYPNIPIISPPRARKVNVGLLEHQAVQKLQGDQNPVVSGF
jgi:hypothetical protein